MGIQKLWKPINELKKRVEVLTTEHVITVGSNSSPAAGAGGGEGRGGGEAALMGAQEDSP